MQAGRNRVRLALEAVVGRTDVQPARVAGPGEEDEVQPEADPGHAREREGADADRAVRMGVTRPRDQDDGDDNGGSDNGAAPELQYLIELTP